MKTSFDILLGACLALAACGPVSLPDPSAVSGGVSPRPSGSPSAPVPRQDQARQHASLQAISIQSPESEFMVGAESGLKLRIDLSNGFIFYRQDRFLSPDQGLAGDILWDSSNPSVASVDARGHMRALSPGNAVIRASLLGQAVERKIKVSAPARLVSLQFHEASLEFNSPKASPLTFDFVADDGSGAQAVVPDTLILPCAFRIESSDRFTLDVTQAGIAIPLKNGSVELRASCGALETRIAATVAFPADSKPGEGHGGTPAPALEGAPTVLPAQAPSPQEEETLQSIHISTETSELLLGAGSYAIKCRLHFNTGIIPNVVRNFTSPQGQSGTVLWESDDDAVVTFNVQGKAVPQGYGITTIRATIGQVTVSQEARVLISPVTPADPDHRYLHHGNEFDIDYGEGAGFSSHLFPQILYGPPRPVFLTHVLSMGFDGSLDITLNDFVIVDGPGPDFSVFENVVSDEEGSFPERAFVSVSRDGIHYTPFGCTAFDPEELYGGCAGVTPFSEGNPLDPAVSGGDLFDLGDISVPVAKYIRIQDAGTCVPGDLTYPLCAEIGKKGFDMDALAILNGRREPLDINY